MSARLSSKVNPSPSPQRGPLDQNAEAADGSDNERTLADEEARGRAILESAVDAIISIDDRGIIESVNPAAERLFGYSERELVGTNVSILMPEPYASEHDAYITQYLRTGIKKIIGIGREVVARRKDGASFPVHLAVGEIRYSDRQAFVGIIRDISDLAEANHKLISSERLAILGEAATRLAHESRNSLQRIQLAVETARLASRDNPSLLRQLDSIERSSEEIGALLTEVRDYASPLGLDKILTRVANLWHEAWQSLAESRRGRIASLRDSGALDLRCHVDRFRIAEVFRNLMENSLAACSDPVEITIAAREIEGEGAGMAEIRFCDNGPGLGAEQLQRVFEPFYTTRSKGTGLGMAIARRIVEAHGGQMDVGDTEVGGAEFVICLPLSDG